jgi:hypothetical protein
MVRTLAVPAFGVTLFDGIERVPTPFLLYAATVKV